MPVIQYPLIYFNKTFEIEIESNNIKTAKWSKKAIMLSPNLLSSFRGIVHDDDDRRRRRTPATGFSLQSQRSGELKIKTVILVVTLMPDYLGKPEKCVFRYISQVVMLISRS